MLHRLLALNHQRYNEEMEVGLYGKKAKQLKSKKAKGDVTDSQLELL